MRIQHPKSESPWLKTLHGTSYRMHLWLKVNKLLYSESSEHQWLILNDLKLYNVWYIYWCNRTGKLDISATISWKKPFWMLMKCFHLFLGEAGNNCYSNWWPDFVKFAYGMICIKKEFYEAIRVKNLARIMYLFGMILFFVVIWRPKSSLRFWTTALAVPQATWPVAFEAWYASATWMNDAIEIGFVMLCFNKNKMFNSALVKQRCLKLSTCMFSENLQWLQTNFPVFVKKVNVFCCWGLQTHHRRVG